jgi:branched-subunit amino acid transport protein
MNFSGRFDFISDEGERSSVSRALQYVVIYDKMHEAPFFGFGRERNYLMLFKELHAVDNYYFWTILEVGIIGISVYSFFLYMLVRTALSQYKVSYRSYYLLALIIAILMSIFYQNLMANPANHIYLYIFAGLICVIKVLQNEKREKLEHTI